MAIGVRLMGGLGNQMFQYAAARSLAARRGTGVVVDLGWFVDQPDGDTLRAYALDAFVGPAAARRAERAPETLWRERGFGFDPSVHELPDESTLVGYFQSERYFCEHAGLVRADFGVRHDPDARNAFVLELARSSESVAVHVRRGDYASNAATRAHHGLLPVEYYQLAAEEIAARVNEPRFFVFSDDPEWCRSELAFLASGVVVDHNASEGVVEDLRLMAACRHHVVANSTFSWWGAWLADHDEQVVVAPRDWFAAAGSDTADLCPDRWLRR